MKNFKKLMALVIAGAMVIGTMSMGAFAAPGDLDHNSTLTVSGLGAADTVQYYQILAWDVSEETGDPANGWVWGSSIDKTKVGELTPADFYGSTDGQNKITFAKAGAIGKAATTAVGTGTNTNGTWTATNVDPGLYMVVITSNTPGTMYNPVFVAANFIGGNETNIPGSSWILTSDASYSDEAVAKKSTIPLDKKTTGTDTAVNVTEQNGNTPNAAHTTDVGEIVEYEVTTKIPKFGDNYTSPVFTLTDTLTGLVLETVPEVKDSTGTTLTADTDYTLTGAKGDGGYTIAFTADYLLNKLTHKVGNAGEEITVTYSAKVTDAAEKIVNQENNTVELKFSANPSDTSGKAKLLDETNHFTFSIDAGLFGSTYGKESSTEAIKIGVDKDGNPIEEVKTYTYNGGMTHAALEGATFKLYTDKDCTVPYKDGNNKERTAVSDATGRITILGLDAGNYWLKEESAPNGYIKMQESVPVVISAVINENVTVDDSYDIDGTKVTTTHKTNELVSYSVQVGNQTTFYQMENSADGTSLSTTRETRSSDSELVNTKGVELPSTGGMGTTLFYAIGAILVLGAGILLVSKRRMSAN